MPFLGIIRYIPRFILFPIVGAIGYVLYRNRESIMSGQGRAAFPSRSGTTIEGRATDLSDLTPAGDLQLTDLAAQDATRNAGS